MKTEWHKATYEHGERQIYRWEVIFVVIAVVIAIALRVRGLGVWPLTTDEFYFVRSVLNFSEFGLPQFPCGGYYTRGFLLQLATIPLIASGLDQEFASRLIPVLSSGVAIAGAYALSRAIVGRPAAIAITVALTISAWHVEMARFARMYAPFQALFIWHVYFLVQRITSEKRWPRLALLLTTLVAPLVWEGGIFAVLLTLIVPIIRKTFRPLWETTFYFVVLALSAVYLRTDFRTGAMFTDDLFASADPSRSTSFELPYAIAVSSPLAAAFATIAVLAGVALLSLQKVTKRGDSVDLLDALAILAIVATIAINQAFLTLLAITGFRLTGWLNRGHVVSRAARPGWLLWLTLLCYLIWLAIGSAAPQNGAGLFGAAKSILDYPNVLDAVLRPWTHAMGFYGGLVVILPLAGAVLHGMLRDQRSRAAVSVLYITIVISLAALGALSTTFQATRYGFFLYPVLLIATAHILTEVAAVLFRGRLKQANTLAAILVVTIFFLGADFRPTHVAAIADYKSNFRVGFRPEEISHFYKRFDFDAANRRISENRDPEDAVVATMAESSFYIEDLEYIYLDESDGRYRGQSCNRMSTERWTNLPLLSNTTDVNRIREDRRIWLLIGEQARQHNAWEQAMYEVADTSNSWVTPDGSLRVILLPALTSDSDGTPSSL